METIVSVDLYTAGESVEQFLANLSDYLAQRGDKIERLNGHVPLAEYDAAALVEEATDADDGVTEHDQPAELEQVAALFECYFRTINLLEVPSTGDDVNTLSAMVRKIMNGKGWDEGLLTRILAQQAYR